MMNALNTKEEELGSIMKELDESHLSESEKEPMNRE